MAKLFGITYLVGKIKFKLFFQGPLAKWENEKLIIQDHEIFNMTIGDIPKGEIATIRTHVSFTIFCGV